MSYIQALPALDDPGFYGCECGGGWSEGLIPVAISLAVALLAWSGFYYLRGRVEAFDLEMRTVSLALVNDLARFRRK